MFQTKEEILERESHFVEDDFAHFVGKYTRIWCPVLDEAQNVISGTYAHHCPMCGEEL